MFEYDENEVYHEMYLHLLWSTKEQTPYFSLSASQYVYEYIRDLPFDCKSTVIAGKVFQDHLELVVKITPDVALCNLLTTIKTSTCLLMRTNFPDCKSFEWQESDFSFSISKCDVGSISDGFDGKKSFQDKIYSLLDASQIEYCKQGVLT